MKKVICRGKEENGKKKRREKEEKKKGRKEKKELLVWKSEATSRQGRVRIGRRKP